MPLALAGVASFMFLRTELSEFVPELLSGGETTKNRDRLLGAIYRYWGRANHG